MKSKSTSAQRRLVDQVTPCLEKYRVGSTKGNYFLRLITACAAARRAVGTRNGEQLT